MKKFILAAAFVCGMGLVACSGHSNVPTVDSTDSVEVVDSVADTAVIDTVMQ